MLFRRKPRSLGEQGERLAAKTLRKRGYKILERNAQLGRYEVDLIVRKGDTVAFVEVKTRREEWPIPPEENVDGAKQRHISHAADWWIARNGDEETYYRFDIVAIVMPEKGRPRVRVIEDAFQG